MSDPALFDTHASEMDEPDSALVVAMRAAWKERWVSLRDNVRARPPAEGSPQETEALAQFAVTMLDSFEKFGADALSVLLDKAQGGIEAMWRREYAETAVERKLAMRLVGEALKTLANLLQEMKAYVPARELPVTLDRARRELVQVERWPASTRCTFKLELYAFIAFDLASSEDTSEFCAWARRAFTAAREAAAASRSSSFQAPEGVASGDDIVATHLTLVEPDADRVARTLDEAPEPNEALRSFLRDD